MSDMTREARTPTATGPFNAQIARNWWAIAIRGFFGIVFGAIALIAPGVTMLSLALVFSAYLMVDGIMAIVASVRSGTHGGSWAWMLAEGLLSILVSLIALFLPGLTVLTFILVVAAWALVTGVLMIAAAFRLDGAHGRWWLALGGAASVVYGAALVIAPMIGALVLTWWLGAYAIVFGVMLIVAAFQLRSRHMDRMPPRGQAGAVA